MTLKPRRQRFRASTCSYEHRLSVGQLVLLLIHPLPAPLHHQVLLRRQLLVQQWGR